MAAEKDEAANPLLPNPLGQILTTEQIAKILQISQRTVQRAIREGHLKAHRVKRVYRVHAKDLQEWWAKMRIEPDDQ
jgi:excisionase family DNA binding protein